jgi:hypothetical protein
LAPVLFFLNQERKARNYTENSLKLSFQVDKTLPDIQSDSNSGNGTVFRTGHLNSLGNFVVNEIKKKIIYA